MSLFFGHLSIRRVLLQGNDDLSQISAYGLGRDFYWPPYPEGIQRDYTARCLQDLVGLALAPVTHCSGVECD